LDFLIFNVLAIASVDFVIPPLMSVDITPLARFSFSSGQVPWGGFSSWAFTAL